MLTINYRCVQSPNISIDVTKCGEIFHKFTLYTNCLSVTKNTCLDWTIYSWWGFNSWDCPAMLTTNYRCVQTPNISVDVTKFGGEFSQFLPVHSLFVCYKKGLLLTEQSIHGKFVLSIKRTSSWVESLPLIDCSVKISIFCKRQTVRVLDEFVKMSPTFGYVYTDVGWLNTSIVCS